MLIPLTPSKMPPMTKIARPDDVNLLRNFIFTPSKF
jgi:hypothetical protein